LSSQAPDQRGRHSVSRQKIFFNHGACKTIQIGILHSLSIQIGIVSGKAKARTVPLQSATSLSKAGEFIMKSIITLHRLNRSLLAVSVVVAAVTGVAATAQAQSLAYSQRMPPSTQSMAAAEWNGRSVARTGATVPNPGTAKIGPQSEIERRAQTRSAKAIRTICIGCL
jgi:hypothetical protein